MKTINGNKYVTIHFGINKYHVESAKLVLGKNIKHSSSWRKSDAFHVLIEDIENAEEILTHIDEDGEAILQNRASDLPVKLGYTETKMKLKFL